MKSSVEISKGESSEVGRLLKDIKSKKNDYWVKQKEERALKLFHAAAEGVPAYKKFLKAHKIDHTKIKTFKDFQSVPFINKKNYIRPNKLKDLNWMGNLDKPTVLTSTSGSTGESVYFSRNSKIDWQSSVIHELFLKTISANHKEPTLIIICFGMGVWIGGLITYQAFELAASRGYPLSLITPGINKEEIFKALKKLAPEYKQVILAGYPPFLKDIIDEAPHRGIKIKDLNVKFLFAAEAFTEKFRDYMLKQTKNADALTSNMNIYGSADIGTMAFETPLSILVRKIAMKKPAVFESLFGKISKTPTLAQYDPEFITFEAPDGEIVLTGNSSMPLVRYSIGDHGGVFSFKELHEKLALHKVYLHKEAEKAGITDKLFQLPFVFVFERMDFSTTLYGLQIYPETVREVLLDAPYNQFCTGKITLETKFDSKQDQYIEINVELQRSQQETDILKSQLANDIIKNLREKNSEFRELSNFLGERTAPRIVFWPFEDPIHFKPGIKQTWVKK